ELVAAGEEDAGGVLERLEPVGAAGVGAGLEGEGAGAASPELAEDLLVAQAGVGHARGGRDDGDPRRGAAADLDEAAQNYGVLVFLFGAADRHDPAAVVVIFDTGRAHSWDLSKGPNTTVSPRWTSHRP